MKLESFLLDLVGQPVWSKLTEFIGFKWCSGIQNYRPAKILECNHHHVPWICRASLLRYLERLAAALPPRCRQGFEAVARRSNQKLMQWASEHQNGGRHGAVKVHSRALLRISGANRVSPSGAEKKWLGLSCFLLRARLLVRLHIGSLWPGGMLHILDPRLIGFGWF